MSEHTRDGTAIVLGIRRSTVWEERETTAEEDCSSTAAHDQREVVQAATIRSKQTRSKEGTQLIPRVLRPVWSEEPTAKN